MNTLTKILSDEHKNIFKLTNILLKECDASESGKELDRNLFGKAVDFVQNYADKFHHAKEENIFFVELCEDTAQMHCNPIPQMLSEHELGRNFVKKMKEGLEENNKKKLIEGARGYSQLLQEHIYKEDNILYPMAELALNQKIQKQILDKFEQAEQTFGQKKEQYLSFLK